MYSRSFLEGIGYGKSTILRKFYESEALVTGFAKAKFTPFSFPLLVGLWATSFGLPVTKYNEDVLLWFCSYNLVTYSSTATFGVDFQKPQKSKFKK